MQSRPLNLESAGCVTHVTELGCGLRKFAQGLLDRPCASYTVTAVIPPSGELNEWQL